jgi:hypothetical protein
MVGRTQLYRTSRIHQGRPLEQLAVLYLNEPWSVCGSGIKGPANNIKKDSAALRLRDAIDGHV